MSVKEIQRDRAYSPTVTDELPATELDYFASLRTTIAELPVTLDETSTGISQTNAGLKNEYAGSSRVLRNRKEPANLYLTSILRAKLEERGITTNNLTLANITMGLLSRSRGYLIGKIGNISKEDRWRVRVMVRQSDLGYVEPTLEDIAGHIAEVRNASGRIDLSEIFERYQLPDSVGENPSELVGLPGGMPRNEHVKWYRYISTGREDNELRNELISRYFHYVYPIAASVFWSLKSKLDEFGMDKDSIVGIADDKIFDAVKTFDLRGTPFKAYFRTIVYNASIDQIRRRAARAGKSRNGRRTKTFSMGSNDILTDSEISPPKSASILSLFETAREELSVDQWNIIQARYQHGLSISKIARKLGMSEAKVKWQHGTALRRIRSRLPNKRLDYLLSA